MIRSAGPDNRGGEPRAAPMISVIINNYNYGRYVGAAIASVLEQQYPNVECIVVDDGSTDESLDVINSFAGIQVIAKPNGGQISAAIEGFGHARGDLILFLDSDDYLLPEACTVLAEHYSPDCSLYQFKLDIRDSSHRRLGEYPREPFVRDALMEHVRKYGYFPSSPTSGNAFSRAHVAGMFARIAEVPKLFIDGYLIYSAPFFGAVRVIDRALGIYRVHGDNVSLSAGVTVKSAKNDVLNAIWQRTAIVQCLHERGVEAGTPLSFLSPYHLRNALILRLGYPEEPGMDFMSKTALAVLGMRKFLDFPNLSLWKRIKNICLIALLPWGPPELARRILPRDLSPRDLPLRDLSPRDLPPRQLGRT